MSATTGNFIEGGTVDPFSPTGQPLTIAEQNAMEQERRRRRIEEDATKTANVNNRSGGYNAQRGGDAAAEHAFDVARYGGQEAYDRHWREVKKRNVAEAGKNFWGRAADTVAEHPWLPLLPLAPLAGAAFAPGAAGAGSLTATGGGAAGSSAAPIIVANEAIPGAATAGPAVAAPGSTAVAIPEFTQGAADAYNAAHGFGAVTSAATSATSAAPAASAAFDVGGAIKDVAPILSAVGPLAYDQIWGGKTKEEQALIAKQRQLAQETEAHRREAQESRMNALGQQLLAMNPSNKMMAQMFGPDAAFQPEQMAAMVQNPIPPPAMPPELKAMEGRTGKNTPEQNAAFRKYQQQLQQYEEGNRRRTEQMMNGIQPPGPGAPPLQQRAPQPARKY